MNNSRIEFLPFTAINIFMRPDYKQNVIQKVFNYLSTSPDDIKYKFNRLLKKYVTISGFRNSVSAPTALKIRPYISAFEKQSELTAFTLDTWAHNNLVLVDKVYEILVSRGWELLPKETDRTKLPGFLVTWKNGEDFEGITRVYKEKFPDEIVNEDDISLMTVWLSGRLPYQDEVKID